MLVLMSQTVTLSSLFISLPSDRIIFVYNARPFGQIVLLSSCRGGHLLVVLNLVNHGYMQINDINIQGKTALHLASQEGHVNVVDYLLQRGARISRYVLVVL